MAVELTCQACGDSFTASRKSAKWCGDRCRKAAGRGQTPPIAPDPVPKSAAPDEPTGLVASVRADLERADRVNTFSGQLALQLARRLSDPEESGISSLSKELRTVMAAALDGVAPPSAEAAPAVDEGDPEDEVTKARRQHAQARQAAGLA